MPLGESAAVPGVAQHVNSSDRLYRPQLDALRFLAFLAVFLFHLTHEAKVGPSLGALSESGAFGMCVFFILSSYLITTLLVREQTRFGTIHVRAFYVRRALRIWPLYFLFLGANFALGHAVPKLAFETPRLLAFVFMMGNWYVAAFGFGTSAIYPLWSISLEEQFYLVWPALVGTSRRFLLAGSCLLIPVSLACTYILAARGASLDQIWVNSLTQFLFFACGSLLAIYEGKVPIGPQLSRGVLLLTLGFGAWWAIEMGFHLKSRTVAANPILTTVGYAALAISCLFILRGTLSIPGHLVPSWLRYLGKISFGLYVFHKFCLDHAARLHTPLLNAMLSLGATIVCAAASYHFVEKPFLALKKRFELVQSRPI
jgi:peptidoglycan/LPS O-acetylase OafA/YrhL